MANALFLYLYNSARTLHVYVQLAGCDMVLLCIPTVGRNSAKLTPWLYCTYATRYVQLASCDGSFVVVLCVRRRPLNYLSHLRVWEVNVYLLHVTCNSQVATVLLCTRSRPLLR